MWRRIRLYRSLILTLVVYIVYSIYLCCDGNLFPFHSFLYGPLDFLVKKTIVIRPDWVDYSFIHHETETIER